MKRTKRKELEERKYRRTENDGRRNGVRQARETMDFEREVSRAVSKEG